MALKEILEGLADHPETRLRFLQEAQITSQLEHPNILPIYGLGYRSDGAPYLIMRYIRGCDLRQAIQDYSSRSGDVREMHRLLRAFVGACKGIAFANAHGVLHRDPKPGNILLGDSGEGIVLDWGLAKVHGPQGGEESEGRKVVLGKWADPGLTAEGAIMGTPPYMAPRWPRGDIILLTPAQTSTFWGRASLNC